MQVNHIHKVFSSTGLADGGIGRCLVEFDLIRVVAQGIDPGIAAIVSALTTTLTTTPVRPPTAGRHFSITPRARGDHS
jgi:hypothetical protein